jgi:hypothetical protein
VTLADVADFVAKVLASDLLLAIIVETMTNRHSDPTPADYSRN